MIQRGTTMPEYTFLCDKDNGGCGHGFSIVVSMTEYKDEQTCPACKKAKGVRRCLEADLPTLNTSVRKGDHQITVGELAKRNNTRLSSDEKAHLTYEQNKYKYEEPTRELPDGMSRMGSPKDRIATKKQRTRDPKRKRKNDTTKSGKSRKPKSKRQGTTSKKTKRKR